MKYLLLLAFPLYLNANVLIISDPCTSEKRDIIPFETLNTASVQHITENLLSAHEIEFEATDNGILSIYNTPYGSEAYEIQDHRNMRSYGWCYEVNGYQPNVTADRYSFNPLKHREIHWIFGMAEMKDGVWISYCTPLSEVPNNSICN